MIGRGAAGHARAECLERRIVAADPQGHFAAIQDGVVRAADRQPGRRPRRAAAAPCHSRESTRVKSKPSSNSLCSAVSTLRATICTRAGQAGRRRHEQTSTSRASTPTVRGHACGTPRRAERAAFPTRRRRRRLLAWPIFSNSVSLPARPASGPEPMAKNFPRGDFPAGILRRPCKQSPDGPW